METSHGFFAARQIVTLEAGRDVAEIPGILGYPNIFSKHGILISHGLATLHELDTVYSVEDAYILIDIVLIDRHNQSMVDKYRESQR